MLCKIVVEYAEKEAHLVLDNARCQKCQAVCELTGQLGTRLEYILSYSPNLNLIESLWKFVKGILPAKYYSEFSSFKQEIDSSSSAQTEKQAKNQQAQEQGCPTFFSFTPIEENEAKALRIFCLFYGNFSAAPSDFFGWLYHPYLVLPIVSAHYLLSSSKLFFHHFLALLYIFTISFLLYSPYF